MESAELLASDRHLYLLTAGAGAAAWGVPWLLLDGQEAWDHWSYFIISLPAMSAIAAYAGFRARSRWWRWPLTLGLAQFVVLLLLGGFGNLLPLGIVAFAILAVPMLITAGMGAWIAQKAHLAKAKGGT
jgi:hypothetical protein